jgi:heme-degrading monooxygenase HmoA
MVLLINPFRVFAGKEAAFLDLWDQTGAIFRAKRGYIRARLVTALPQQPPGQAAPYTHINVAEWESAEAYTAALGDPGLRRLGGEYLKVCTFNPALYSILRDL